MAKKIKQFRFYGNSTPNNNSPSSLSYQNLVSGSAFAEYTPILSLGIQSIPGAKFYLNGSPEPIVIGNSGLFDLDLKGELEILSLSFDATSLYQIGQNSMAYLIVDIIYEGAST